MSSPASKIAPNQELLPPAGDARPTGRAQKKEVCDLAVEVVGLSCGYGGAAILEDLHFAVRTGEIFFIIGGSGCGKSTLMRSLIGLHPPLAGEVRFFGEVFDSSNLASLAVSRPRHGPPRLTHLSPPSPCPKKGSATLGVLYQSSALWSSLTLRENVALPLREYGQLSAREVDEIATLKLTQVGLCGFEDYYPSEISGGMKKRAGLARALALDPPLVFLDEPSAGLDPINARKLDELMLQIRDLFGTTLVVISHELGSIFRVADRLILLDKAARGIIAAGAPHELARTSRDPRVREFLGHGTAPQ